MTLVLLQFSPARLLLANLSIQATTPLSLSSKHVLFPRIFYSELSYRGLFKRFSSNNENTPKIFEGFLVLESDIPWESGKIWSTMALYFFSLHIPFSFGGLSLIVHMLHQPNLESEAKALSILVIQTLELFSALLLLQFTAKPHSKLPSFFKPQKLPSERNWLLAAALGFVFLILVVFLTSFLTDRIVGSKVVSNPVLKEILLGGKVSDAACIAVYCVITPTLEEIVYRGFLLTCLAATMKWPEAVVISSAIFSIAHLSGENFLQLFVIGSVLGCCYCWTGNLSSSIVIHSLYNAFILLVTYFA